MSLVLRDRGSWPAGMLLVLRDPGGCWFPGSPGKAACSGPVAAAIGGRARRPRWQAVVARRRGLAVGDRPAVANGRPARRSPLMARMTPRHRDQPWRRATELGAGEQDWGVP